MVAESNYRVKLIPMDRPLRIAVWYNLPSGGAKRALYNHLKGLKSRGHTIEAFRPPIESEEFTPIAEVSDKEHVIPWPSWEGTAKFPLARIYETTTQVHRYVQAAETHAQDAAVEIHKGGFDLLFANTCLQFHSPFIGRYVKLPKLLYLQEPKRPFYEPMPRLPWIAKDSQPVTGLRKLRTAATEMVDLRSVSIQGREELNNARSFDQILVNSFFSREALLRAYGISAKVCYLGTDPGKFKDLGLPRENFVMGIGTLGPSKNVRLAVEGVGQVPKQIRPKLIWVANMTSAPYKEECVSLARDLNVDFEAKEMISDDELVSLLNRASAMVYAPRLEPFGFAPLEANFCRLPVVAVAEGGVRETVVDGLNGLLVDHDPEKLGAAITKLLSDEPLRARLGEQGYRIAYEKWGVDASVDRLEREIQTLLRQSAPSA